MNSKPRIGEPHLPYRRATTIFICVQLWASVGIGQVAPTESPSPTPTNLDFEQGEPGQSPPGWTLPDGAKKIGYEAFIDAERPHSGKHCVVFRSKTRTYARSGTLMQTVDARPYRGKRVRFRAYARTEALGDGSQVQMWFRVELPSGIGFYDDMVNRPIKAADWQAYEIVGDVDEDAQSISYGFVVRKDGTAWFDSASLEVVPGGRISKEPPRALTEDGRQNVIAFAKLYGYVRYFHPSDQAAGVNWNQFAVDSVGRVEKARGAAELARQLADIFRPIAPTLRVFVSPRRPTLPPELLPSHPEGLKVKFWSHYGYGWGNKAYHSERVESEWQPDRDPRKPFLAHLGKGVLAWVPTVLWSDAQGTLPHLKVEVRIDPQSMPPSTARDRTTRLAAVVIAWNILQHFYSYFDVVNTDWPSVLSSSLTRAAVDSDTQSFLASLKRLTAQLHDAHAAVFHASTRPGFRAPITWDWAENRIVIARVEGNEKDIHPGDIVHAINGRTVDVLLQETEQLISGATEGWNRHMALLQLAEGEKNGEIELELESTSTGQRYTKRLRRTLPIFSFPVEPPIENFKEVVPGVYYVNLTQMPDAELEPIWSKLATAKGVILDARGYTRTSSQILGHFSDAPMSSQQWHVPFVVRPDRENLTFKMEQWSVKPLTPRIRARTAFLIDARAMSHSETDLSFVAHYKLGELVGQATAGTNGDPNHVLLPGGFELSWTGCKTLNQDGSQLHGIGIRPTVPVSRTIKGIAEGRDEVLEAAIRIVTQQTPSSHPSDGGTRSTGLSGSASGVVNLKP